MLDKGIFCIIWVGLMWVTDTILYNTGVTTYAALMIGACVLTLIGLTFQGYVKLRKN